MGNDVKELHLTMQLRNNRMISRRRSLRLTTRQASEAAGIAVNTWCDYESLRTAPHTKRRDVESGNLRWKQSALSVARALGVSCEWLWPDEVLDIVSPKVVAEVDVAQVRPMLVSSQLHPPVLPADAQIESEQLDAGIDRALDMVLTERERSMLLATYGFDDGHSPTLDQLATAYSLSRERTRQIVAKALAKLRHPKVAKLLRERWKGPRADDV